MKVQIAMKFFLVKNYLALDCLKLYCHITANCFDRDQLTAQYTLPLFSFVHFNFYVYV